MDESNCPFLFLAIAVEDQQVTVLRLLLVLLADSILHMIPTERDIYRESVEDEVNILGVLFHLKVSEIRPGHMPATCKSAI